MFQLDLVGAWREEFNERELDDARLCPNCSKKAIRDLYPGMTDGAVDAHLNMLTNLSGSDPSQQAKEILKHLSRLEEMSKRAKH